MTTEIAVPESTLPAVRHELTIEELVAQHKKIKDAMAAVMDEGVHWGKIPGTPKPTLYQPGAQTLNLLFRLDPQYVSMPVGADLGGGGHLTIKSLCTLWHIPTGERLGSGEGSCSSREAKYAYRTARRTCPTCGKEAIIRGKVEWGGGWLCFKKQDGCGAKFKDGDAAIETQEVGRVANPDLPDMYNTILKMANKRALVAAVLNVTAASDLFTQDLEDFHEEDARPGATPAATAPTAPQAAPQATPETLFQTPDEQQERAALVGKIRGAVGVLKLSPQEEAALVKKHMGSEKADMRTADVSALQMLYDDLSRRRTTR